MGNKFIKSDKFGELFIDEIFVYYDAPQIFTCKNVYDNIYLFTYADFDNDFDMWLSNPISRRRLSYIKSHKMPILEALINPEDGSHRINKHIYNYKNNRLDESFILSTEIDINYLPDSDYFIDFTSNYLKPLDKSLTEIASSDYRDVISLSFKDKYNSHEIEANALASLIKAFQSIITTIDLKTTSLNGRINSEKKKKTALQAAGLLASSFGILFKSNDYENIIHETGLFPSVKQTIELFDASENPDSIKRFYINKNPRSISYLQNFYEVMLKYELSADIRASSSRQDYVYTFISKDTLKNRILALNTVDSTEKEERIISGKFIQINISNRSFTFIPEIEDENISGKIAESVDLNNDELEELPIFSHYEIKLHTVIEINKATGEEYPKHTILAINKT